MGSSNITRNMETPGPMGVPPAVRLHGGSGQSLWAGWPNGKGLHISVGIGHCGKGTGCSPCLFFSLLGSKGLKMLREEEQVSGLQD